MRTSATDIAAQLEDTFAMIERERMADVPILNKKLAVEAIGFQEWNGEYLGVLITPWFMNLMLLPFESTQNDRQCKRDTAPHEPRSGDTSTVDFPAAEFEFIHGEEAGLGSYRMCSLFSPVFEFEDHAAAVATAKSVLEQLMTSADAEADKERTEPGLRHTQPGLEPVSRRDLLRGLTKPERAQAE